MIEIKNVNFSYSKEGKKRLKNINLHIRDGECVLLCGKSGCGKTTVTKLINGLIPHFCEEGELSGEVLVNGMNVSKTKIYELSRYVGSVFQNPKSQFFHINSDAELCFSLENYGVAEEKIRTSLKRTIQNLRIQHLLHRNVFQMSGGEKQSLAFASVAALNPDIYVLDEPTANLDEESILKLREQLKVMKSQGKTIVIAEHRLWFLADFVDRAIYLEDGEIKKIFSAEELLSLDDRTRVDMGLRKVKNPSPKFFGTITEGELMVSDVSVGYKKKHVLDHVTFSAKEGEVLALIGRNGTGKTTLLRTLCGLTKKLAGTITLNGVPMKGKDLMKHAFIIMQDVNYQLFSDSVWNECVLCGAKESEIQDRLEEFDLLSFKESHPMALSGGQKQRLAIVNGLLISRKIVLFDEPTSGLDYLHMETVAKTIRRIAEEGKIVIVVTHDKEFVDIACDRMLDMNQFQSVKEPCISCNTFPLYNTNTYSKN